MIFVIEMCQNTDTIDFYATSSNLANHKRKVADLDTVVRVGTLTVLQKLHKPSLQQVFFEYRRIHQKYLLTKITNCFWHLFSTSYT